jgi:hypothetical protein
MPAQHEIKCINKTNRSDPHEKISHIGGINPDGRRWWITQEEAIAGIETQKWQFYVNVNGKSVWVVIARSAFGNKYIKTEADGDTPNNLLSLPECP